MGGYREGTRRKAIDIAEPGRLWRNSGVVSINLSGFFSEEKDRKNKTGETAIYII